MLKDPHNGITHLRERKILANTDARPSVEGDIRPAFRNPVVPSLRVEFVDWGEFRRGRWVKGWVALHVYCGVGDGGVFEDADGE